MPERNMGMEIKKAPEADLENKRGTWLLMGYVAVLALLYIALEWNTRDEEQVTDWISSAPVYEEEIELPPSQLPGSSLPPPPPPATEEVIPSTDRLTLLDDLSKELETSFAPIDETTALSELAAIPMEESHDRSLENTVYDIVEQMPEFPDGGIRGLMRYLTQHIFYPDAAVRNRIQGQVTVQFIVEADGSIADVSILKGVHLYLDREALRVIRRMPRWKPGIRDGQPVRVRCTLPVIFKL